MESYGFKKTGFLVSVISGLIITCLLFFALPLLTRMHRGDNERTDRSVPVLLSNRKPPPPPAEDRDKPKVQTLVEKEARKTVKKSSRVQPKFDIPKAGITMAGGSVGVVEIGVVSDFKISDSLYMSAFTPLEVDQPPRAIRSFPPQYPYLARRDNIEGRVLLKFVVDIDGLAKETRVVEAEPEGVFEEAALKAIERYKFRPAIKNGKPVLCVVRLPISFKLD